MCVGCAVEHVFEVVLQGVRGLKLLETMIWGEADCFVQYFFPVQSQAQHQGPTVVYGESSALFLGDEFIPTGIHLCAISDMFRGC